jgi:hypothetical protein
MMMTDYLRVARKSLALEETIKLMDGFFDIANRRVDQYIEMLQRPEPLDGRAPESEA